MQILLVRHGESEGNAEKRMQGHADFPLSELGRAQAERLGRWLAAHGFRWDAARTSPLSRARTTAEILARTTGFVEATVDPNLAELRAGSLEGMTRQDMEEKHPSFLERGVTELGDFGEYGGESYDDVQKRVEALLESVFEEHREPKHRVLLVAHGGINFQLVKRLVCLPVPKICIVRMGNCTATLVTMRDRRGVYLGEINWHVPVELMGAGESEGTSELFR